MSAAVPSSFAADMADALEQLTAQARDATGATVADAQLEQLARHLRGIVRMSGKEIHDWRLALVQAALDPSRGVRLGAGALGYSLRKLAVTPDSRDVSVDRLINGLAVLAVESRLKADNERIQAAERDGQRSSRGEAQVTADFAVLEQRATEAEAAADELQAHVARLESDLVDERKRVEFLRGFVPDDVAAESDKRPASDNKRRVDRGIYARTRADGTEAFQVVGNSTRPGATFDDLHAAVAYRDGGSAGTESEPPAGPSTDDEQVAA